MEILEALHYTEEDKRSLYESLLRGYERSGDKSVALAFYGNHITWKQFMHEVDCIAAALLSRGVKKRSIDHRLYTKHPAGSYSHLCD